MKGIQNQGSPDFFLGSSEHRDDWARARACRVTSQFPRIDGRESVVIQVSPPVIGQALGLGDLDVADLILAARSRTGSFKQPIPYPMPVLIYRSLTSEVSPKEGLQLSDLTLSAWGEIYPTMEDAQRAARGVPNLTTKCKDVEIYGLHP